jgi:hypothetical protein
MGLLTKILLIIIVVLLVLTFIPVSIFGEELVDVTVSARVNQAKVIGWIPGLKAYNIDNVRYEVTGDTNLLEWDSLFFIAEYGNVEFCIDDICQGNGELFLMSPGEQRTTTETIHGITRGTHTLTITFTVGENVEDTYTQEISV